MGTVYKLDFPNGKSYIGVTRLKLNKRIGGHKRHAELGSQFSIHKAWRKHGAPAVKIIAIVEDRMLAETEMKSVASFKTLVPDGYNMIPGGVYTPMMNEEFKRKASERMKGKPVSEKTRKKMSASARTKVRMTEEQRKRLSEIMKIKAVKVNFTPEVRARLAEAARGNKYRANSVS